MALVPARNQDIESAAGNGGLGGQPSSRSSARGALLSALVVWYLTSCIVFVGAWFGLGRTTLESAHPSSTTRVDLWSSFAAWDGEWYVGIVDNGYTYDPDAQSSVAFFPAFPKLAAVVKWITGWRAEWALLCVSQLALIGCFLTLAMYLAERFPQARSEVSDLSLLSLGLFPTTFWMRMCYTESLFLLSLVVAMLGMQRRWNPIVVALLIGFATATRSAGVALLPVFWWWLWRDRQPRSLPHAIATAAALLPVSIWGLLAYIIYLNFRFGDPWVFIQTQVHWDERLVTGIGDKLTKLLTLEPFWAVYIPSSGCYWGRVPPTDNPLFNMKFWNPIYVLATVGLVGFGVRQRWVNTREVLLVIGLLAIPLWFQAARNCMMSQARYASVIFPAYLVLGQILSRLPVSAIAILSAMSGLMLGLYTALFVSWHWFY